MRAEILADIQARVQKKNIHELRQIARVIGVVRPTEGKKDRLVEDIIKIASCEIPPAPRTARGAPPKSAEFDKQLVADIEDCINYYSASKNGTGYVSGTLEVSDGTSQSECSGILTRGEKYFFLRVNGCFPSHDDIFVHESYINRFGLEEGDYIEGVKTSKSSDEAPALTAVISINGFHPDSLNRIPYEKFTHIYPENRICIAFSEEDTAARMVDLFAPAGLGQRGIICGPANSGKTTLIKQIASGICRNHTELKVVLHLIAERPEDVTYLKRELNGMEIFYTTFAHSAAEITDSAEFVTRYCKKQVECGCNVVLLADGLSGLERASREVGRSGAAKRLLSSAICAEEGGSLTVIATTNAEDKDINYELLSAANMRVELSENCVLQRTYPAIDVLKSGTAHVEFLQSEEEIKTANILRDMVLKHGSQSEIIEIFKNNQKNEDIIKDILNG